MKHRDKIVALFDQRGLAQIGLENNGKIDSSMEALYALQNAIYLLDEFLETNWHLDPVRILSLWEAMIDQLYLINSDGTQQLVLIKKYLQTEMSLRDPVNLELPDLHFFYFCKSCDIKLMRHLMHKRGLQKDQGNTGSAPNLYFDIITEVVDDISDIEEDLQTFNFNYFIVSSLKIGLQATKTNFYNFIDTIEAQIARSISSNSDSASSRCNTVILKHIKACRADIRKVTPDTIHKSTLFPFFEQI